MKLLAHRGTASAAEGGRASGVSRGVSPSALVRRSGLLAVASGVSVFLAPFLHPADPQSAAWVPAHMLYFVTLIAVLLVLVGAFARQLPQTGRLALTGFLTAFLGTSLMLMEGREHLFSHSAAGATPIGLWQLIATSLLFSVGYILFGVAVSRAGVLPRAAGVLLAVGGPIVAFAPPIGIEAVLIVGHTLFGAGLVWLGYGLWSGTEQAPMPR
ncbi:MAG TPA: hypothetical protein VGV91_14560 [Rubrobacter sp.]|nr:hypothetical protein [Rubrobacter sp.]